jgi:hypothetical protein
MLACDDAHIGLKIITGLYMVYNVVRIGGCYAIQGGY